MGKNKYGKSYKKKGSSKGGGNQGGAPIQGGKMKAKHILVDKYTRAQELYEDIQAGESFEALATKYSTCPSRKRGGNLGEFAKGDMVPKFWDAVASLQINEISEPVKTQFGYHIIKRLK